METRKLYYEDSHRRDFTGRVLTCEQVEKGYLVTLDQTVFYPEGGGQAADRGSLGGAEVLDVQEKNGTVFHLCDRPLEIGTEVRGEIDWAWRFDLMQQHSGEHILSGLINRKYGWHNVGFHMGADTVTIDFDGEIDADWLPELEKTANEAVYQDIPLHIWTPSPDELPGVFYRTKRELSWPVRIVEVPGYDSCACCGTHVSRTGEIGPIKILSCIRFRTGVRMEILCGRRAFDYLSRSHSQNQIVSREFSAPIGETGEAARKMNETVESLKMQLGALQRQMAEATAQSLRGKGNVLLIREKLEGNSLRQLGDLVADSCGGTAAVFAGSDDTGYSYCLISRTGDLRPFGKEMNQALQGRGGGKPGFQQGSVRSSRQEIGAYFASGFYLEESNK